jgi:hypothetical protein
VPGKTGRFDLSRPKDPLSAVAYLRDLHEPWVAVRRLDDAVAALLSWDAHVFPCAWLWYELGGLQGVPWHGRARLLGVEPSTSWPGTGLADIARRGQPLLTLTPGREITTELRLQVFKPTGAVRGVDDAGRAVC